MRAHPFCEGDEVPTELVVRIEEAGLGPDAQVRLVLSGFVDLDRLYRPWAASGSTLHREGDRIRATTTPEALTRAVGRTLGAEAAKDVAGVLHRAVAAWAGPAPDVPLPGAGTLGCGGRPLVMGVLNVTPDSFFDGGALYPAPDPRGHPETAIAAGEALVASGADVLDVGGESTRPGSQAVDQNEELDRVVPVVRGLCGTGVPISVDTTKPAVADAACAAGASIVNDVSGAQHEELLAVAADRDAAYVLMHTRGTPASMPDLTDYDDVVAEVYEFLAGGLARCAAAGIPVERVLVDPGIGFAKTPESSFALLAALRQFRGLGRPVLVGASRKSFLRLADHSDDPDQRLESSLASAVAATLAGAAVLRVHDVAETVRAVATAHAIATAGG
jgi:dihydropteroate synthase